MGAQVHRTLVFTYGTLKRGFANHGLIDETTNSGEVSYLGKYRTAERYPLVCGPYCVPFLLNLPGSGDHVSGELYAVSGKAVALMDELEGTCTGHYERLPVRLLREGAEDEAVVAAEAYYAHRSYAEEMWRRNGEKGLCVYSEEEARGYVRRKDRPRDTTFLEQIRIFVSQRGPY